MNQRHNIQTTDLPDSPRLLRSTLLALAAALLLLVTIVLPAEYAIDPTGAGRMLGLTEMGEIKQQLAEEAAADAAMAQARVPTPATDNDARLAAIETQLQVIANSLAELRRAQVAAAPVPAEQAPRHPILDTPVVAPEVGQPPQPLAKTEPPAPEPTPRAEAPSEWRDEVKVVLEPGQGVEFKLIMKEGTTAEFQWTANGSVLNFDTHGDGGGRSVTYEKGRGVGADSGVLTAAFDGNHGWFWRNRTEDNVILTLRTRGDYHELKRTS